MELTAVQKWIKHFYHQRGWTDYGPFIRLNFLMEEVGEVARVVRAYEIGRDRPDEGSRSVDELREELVGELGDVLGNVTLLADLYNISLDEIIAEHQRKLSKRFANE